MDPNTAADAQGTMVMYMAEHGWLLKATEVAEKETMEEWND